MALFGNSAFLPQLTYKWFFINRLAAVDSLIR